MTYTWVRLADGDRLVIPNERLVSETLRNSTVRSANRLAEVTVRLPLSCDLRAATAALAAEGNAAHVTSLDDAATVVVRRWIDAGHALEEAESDLRLAIHDRLRSLGIGQA